MSTRGRGGTRGGRGGRNQPEIGPDGKEINPYIPRYISNAPWYVPKSDDYLEHQRSQQPEIKGEWYDRGKSKPDSGKVGPKKFRKGACKNCGSMGHTERDCLERPRKIKAKYSGMDMVEDEEVGDIATTWDSKRDRWNGYKADDYKAVMERFAREEEKKKELTNSEAEVKEQTEVKDDEDIKEKGDDDFGLDDLGEVSDSEADSEDEDSKKEKTRTLRVREDKARYLQDLGEDAPVFNPKSRTLRTEEEGEINERGQFIRKLTDKAEEHDRYRRLAEEAMERGENIHMEKGPTATLLELKRQEEAKKEKEARLKTGLLNKYGGEEHFVKYRPKEVEEIPKERDPNVAKEVEIADVPSVPSVPAIPTEERIVKSRYEEDVFPGNHTSVWGSHWKDFTWGYACCHSTIKQSYCTGTKGKEINGRAGKAIGIKRKHDEESG